MSGPRLPNFFIVGAPKAGTTSLYHYLDQHPAIYMSPIKEPYYFSAELKPENFVPERRPVLEARAKALREYLNGPMAEKFPGGGPVSDRDDYLQLFSKVHMESAIGEASPWYLWSSTAADRIASEVPDAKIIAILRDPAERAFSEYRQMLASSMRSVSFSEVLDAGFADRGGQIGDTWPFLQFGFYFEQLTRYLRYFRRENIHVAFYEDFRRDPQQFLKGIYKFLRVDCGFCADLSERHMQAHIPRSPRVNRELQRLGIWKAGTKLASPGLRAGLRRVVYRPDQKLRMASAERARLVAFYRDDIEQLARLLDRDLSSWMQ